MNKTKSILLFSILCLLIALPASFAMDNDTVIAAGSLPSHDYYFDAGIENDTGDGSIANPYKTLTSARIVDNSNIHLANGQYNLDRISYVDNVNIIGSNPEKTIVSYYGKGFSLDGPFTLTNVTLVYLAVDANGENFTATNTIFRGYSSSTLSPILGEGGFIDIDNCTFMDNSGYKGGAIYMTGGTLTVNNSLFINNNARVYGGAIACEKDTYAELSNSRFEDDKSNEDAGGAIYSIDSTLKIFNVEINNCYAVFGGAITSVDSKLNLTNFKSKNNRAKYYGGSLYLYFLSNSEISNSTFINNAADLGGALFADCIEGYHLHDNYFINNTAEIGGALYSRLSDCYYDSVRDAELNNVFENNDVFETNSLNITFVDEDYLMIRLDSSDYDGVLPSYYNLRDLGQVTPAKNQEKGGNCWSFASMAALESALLKATNVTYDLSEGNMKNLIAFYSPYGWSMKTNEGGYDRMAIGYLTSWLGPVNESEDAYDAQSILSPLLDNIIHVQNILFLKRDDYTDNDAIKKAIMEYGAVSTSIHWSSSYAKGKNYYYNGNSAPNHAVAIVGWDDTYSKSNFKNTPEGDGAWIIKNSHGTGSGDNGFFYVSYYDTGIAQLQRYVTYAFILNNTIKYDKIYQYDVQGRTDYFLNNTNTVWYKTRFTSTSDEYLKAVSTYFEDYTFWELAVYVNDVLKATKSGKSPSSYSTIDLDHLIPLKAGDVFEIVFKITVDEEAGFPVSEYISLNQETYTGNISFVSYDGKTWADLYALDWAYSNHIYSSSVACIKAFSLFDKIDSNVNINIIYNKISDVSTIVAKVSDEWGNVVRDGSVVFTVDGNQYRSTVIDGRATVNYNLNSNLHDISAAFSGSDYNPSRTSIQFVKPTELEVSFSIGNIEYGQDLIAHVGIHDKNGNVIIDEVNLRIDDLTYKLSVGEDNSYKLPFNLNDGLHEAEISDDGFESKKVNFTVSKSSANLNLNIETIYDTASISVSLSNRFNETVTVNVLGKNTTVKLQNGQATLDYDNLASGNYKVNVYLSDNYQNNFKTSSFEISYKSTMLSVPDLNTYYNSGGEINIKLTDADSNPLSNKYVRVNVNGKTTTIRTDKNGIAVYEAYLENGIHDVNVTFAGDSYYRSSHASAKVNVSTSIILMSDLDKTYGSYYSFKLLDTLGNPLKNYLISVELDGADDFIESDSNGVFSLKITQKTGSHSLVIINPVNGEQISNTINVLSRITGNKAVTMYYGAGNSYTVKVFDDNGNIAKGVSVKFTINGKEYTRTTNSSGYASFKLTQNPGTYTITASYKGFKVSNKVVIKPTLVMSAKTVKKSKTFKYTVKLLDKNGKIQKNKKVTVKFRGKTYAAKTNSKGIATFNVKALSKTGKYALTATYGNAKMSKTITIKK